MISQKDKQRVHDLISLHYRCPSDTNVRVQITEMGLRSQELYYYIADELVRLKPKPQRTPDLTPFIGKGFEKEIEPIGNPREKAISGNPTLEDDPHFLKWLKKPNKKR